MNRQRQRSRDSAVTTTTVAAAQVPAGFSYGFGYGHSQGYTMSSLNANPSWWDNQRIESTVTRDFVIAKFRGDEALRKKLLQPLSFGDGLTDDTYLDWILARAKRIFLILVDIGLVDQIFGVTDDSWADDDLPVPREAVERLALTYVPDEAVDNKFYRRQFMYCVQNIDAGQHYDFRDEEIVPVELSSRKTMSGAQSSWASDKVIIAGKGTELFFRRQISVEHPDQLEIFKQEIGAVREIVHEHVVHVYATYTTNDMGCILLTPATDVTFKQFIQSPPSLFMALPKPQRRRIVVNWLHCLSDGLAFLCRNGFPRPEIRPSSLVIDSRQNYKILYEDIGLFKDPYAENENRDKAWSAERYEYGAPENWVAGVAIHDLPLAKFSSGGRGAARTMSVSTSQQSYPPQSSSSSTSASISSSGSFDSPIVSGTLIRNWKTMISPPEKAAIFSLGCIFLDILSYLLKKSPASFAKHRGQKNVQAGRGGGAPDTSFHLNIPQLQSWITQLDKEARKKTSSDQVVFGVFPKLLTVTSNMIQKKPQARPASDIVSDALYRIMIETFDSGDVHCGEHKVGEGDFQGFGGWASPRTVSSSGKGSEWGDIKVPLARQQSQSTTVNSVAEVMVGVAL